VTQKPQNDLKKSQLKLLMVNYSNTKIYKIESTKGPNIYIGSTAQKYLSKRMDSHRSNYKSWKEGSGGKITSFDLFDEYGVDTCSIILLESFPCNSKDEAHAREAYYIKKYDCVNKYIPGRTKKEYLEDYKDYIREQKKQWRETHKDKHTEDMKQWHLAHKEQRNEVCNCSCGSIVVKRTLLRHEKTVKHLNFLKTLM
jgi:hypothetical protein